MSETKAVECGVDVVAVVIGGDVIVIIVAGQIGAQRGGTAFGQRLRLMRLLLLLLLATLLHTEQIAVATAAAAVHRTARPDRGEAVVDLRRRRGGAHRRHGALLMVMQRPRHLMPAECDRTECLNICSRV